MADTLKSITVTLGATSLAVGATTQAVPTFSIEAADGIASDDFPVAWSSSNTAVATVSSSGAVRAVAPGTAVIRATNGVVNGSASLTVTGLLIPITEAQHAAIMALPVGGQMALKSPTQAAIPVQVVS